MQRCPQCRGILVVGGRQKRLVYTVGRYDSNVLAGILCEFEASFIKYKLTLFRLVVFGLLWLRRSLLNQVSVDLVHAWEV